MNEENDVIIETEPELETEPQPKTYCCIMTDITSGCNLRCKFCVQDWKQNTGNILMSKETFANVIKVMPLTHDGWSLFSCGFESTIHPDFLELFESIPDNLKKKTYFATNLARKFTLDELKRISNLNIGVFNISFESFIPEIYEEFRSGAKFKTFIHNVEILTSLFKEKEEPPQLRFISLLFKQNINEVEEIVIKCQEEYGADINEFRTPFPWTITYNDQDWMKKSLISDKELEEVSQYISSLPYSIKLYNPSMDDLTPTIENVANLNFFINSDGSTKFLDTEINKDLKGFNINSVDDPYNYLKDIFDKILEKYEPEVKEDEINNEQEL